MAPDHQRDPRGYCGPGYAAAGYQAIERSDRHADCRSCSAAAELCYPNRTGIHPPAPGGRNCSSQGKRRSIRPSSETTPGAVAGLHYSLENRPNLSQRSCQTNEDRPRNIEQLLVVMNHPLCYIDNLNAFILIHLLMRSCQDHFRVCISDCQQRRVLPLEGFGIIYIF